MDQLARDEDLQAHLGASEWDLVVVDEAHRMSARWWSGELRRTRRYELGQQLGSIARHLLLMTATPHAGSEENYQLFLALLDPDRFEGRFIEGLHSADTTGLMRRMVKEELLAFEGKPLFPERIAETVPYTLSDGELELYDRVTQYVREEMNRADELRDSGDAPRSRTVGFALTVLQRRLASSTHAILRSLQRRRERLETRRVEMLDPIRHTPFADRFDATVGEAQIEKLLDAEELDAEEAERLEEDVVDAATAARTAAELQVEIVQLTELVALAQRVRDSGQDRKWSELRSLLLDRKLLPRRQRRSAQAHRVHRAPRHARLPRRADPQRAGPRRGGADHPRSAADPELGCTATCSYSSPRTRPAGRSCKPRCATTWPGATSATTPKVRST